MRGMDECECCVVAWCGVAWPVLGRVITPKATGPKHLACVDFAGGQPMWKRRAMARYPPEDHEHLVALCRAEHAEAERDPGRSLFLLCHSFPCSVHLSSSVSLNHPHSYIRGTYTLCSVLVSFNNKPRPRQTCNQEIDVSLPCIHQ